ncbi:MAG: glycosyltransferase [Legionella sp.]|nr:glycosyltransferase [Legionella sp.]
MLAKNNIVTEIKEQIDAVVMLSMSNWKTELRSNRYHYASRFSKLLPVIFVQPSVESETFYFEETELENVTILHVYFMNDSPIQSQLIAQALNQKGIISPLLWIYNPRMVRIISHIFAPYRVYHATEDLFSKDYPSKLSNDYLIDLNRTIDMVDQVICVSPGILSNIVSKNYKWKKKCKLVSNGCDFEFYSKNNINSVPIKKIAFYQGNIYEKLDFELLDAVVKKMPDWSFHFCGPVVHDSPGWKASVWRRLLENKNVLYLGVFTPEGLREAAHSATAGIIPFKNLDYLSKSSFPLKAFEYIACGLPVVTTPIDSLEVYGDIFLFAQGVDAFVAQLLIAEKLKKDSLYLNRAREAAANNSYNKKFSEVIEHIHSNIRQPNDKIQPKLQVLVLYESKSLFITTIKDHLESFGQFSSHNISYASATPDNDEVKDLASYDAVIIHYSLRLSLNDCNWTLSDNAKKQLQSFLGLKIAFIQDEYDTTNIAIRWLQELGVQLLYTCVPDAYVRFVYPSEALPFIKFVNNLTGYITPSMIQYPIKPIKDRETVIAYRGRSLPFWYGDLGQEKEFIGKKMKAICIEKGIKENIEWDDTKRIYGDGWFEFLASAKATLGTESGSNVIDFEGKVSKDIKDYLAEKPSATYSEIYDLFLSSHEGLVKMNQISPKIFEAISLHTALILFEGAYSDILQANKHYIPLKKDFSNIDEVIAKVTDDDYLTELTDNAYQDIVMSNKYTYKNFISEIDRNLYQKLLNQDILKKREIIDEIKEVLEIHPLANPIEYLCTNKRFRKLKFLVVHKIKVFNPLLHKIRLKFS